MVRHAVCGSSDATESVSSFVTIFVDGSLCFLGCVVLCLSVLHSLFYGCKAWHDDTSSSTDVGRSSVLEDKIEQCTRALEKRLRYDSNQIDHHSNEDISDGESYDKSGEREYVPHVMPVTPTPLRTFHYPDRGQELVLQGDERSRDDEFYDSMSYGTNDHEVRDTLETFGRAIPADRENETCCVGDNVLSLQEGAVWTMTKVSHHREHHPKRKHTCDDHDGGTRDNPTVDYKRRKGPSYV
jgi:hypothetical protein